MTEVLTGTDVLTSFEQSVLPERPSINESVTVIGSGIGGLTTAWVLSEAGYSVTVLEQQDEPFDGTSKGVLMAHLGGCYAKSKETAKECLDSAIVMKRLMPFAFSDNRFQIVVADSSDIDLQAYTAFYSWLKDYYSSLPQEDHLFGTPESFFRPLQQNELEQFGNIQGGIETQELLFNTGQTKETLLATLKARGVTVQTSTRVNTIERNNTGKFELGVTSTKTGGKSMIDADMIINAAGYNARGLGQQIGETPMVRLDLRGFRRISIDDPQSAYPSFLVVNGNFIHYADLGGKIAALQGGNNKYDSIVAEKGKAVDLPHNWHDIIGSGQIPVALQTSDIIPKARETFMPRLGSSQIVDMFPGVAVSFNPDRNIKTHRSIGRVDDQPGYLSVIPPKSTHAITLALEATRSLVSNSAARGKVQPTGYLSNILSGKHIGYVK